MAKKESNYYFDVFAKCILFANDAATLLHDCLENYDPSSLKTRIEEMHVIEHAADEVKHEMMRKLVREFLPPIEREDIAELAHTIDDVIDAIEDVLLGMYMYNIKSLQSELNPFTDLVTRCCEALKDMSGELQNFRKSQVLKEKIIVINALEEEGDRLYTESMHRLYTEETDPIQILAWTTLYDRLEKCCDCCEDVADMVEQVILKNS